MSTSDRRDEVDKLLHAAGAAWRATQPEPPEPDLARLRSRRPRRRWAPVLAAASVAAIAVAVAVTVLPNRSGPPGPVAGGGGEAQYLVRDGDRVEVTGIVIAAPERPVVYCPPLSAPSSSGDDAPNCPADFAVTLTGVDLSRLAEPGTKNGIRFGYARLRGTWHDHTITVAEQSTPAANALMGPPDTDPVPCPEPAGGWPVPDPTRNDLPSTAAVERLVEQQPERFGATWVAFADGTVRPARAWTVPVVLVVNLLDGDVDQARRDLQPLYDGNLCVSPGNVTTSRLTEAAHKGTALARDTHNGIWEISGVGPDGEYSGGPVKVGLVVVDERLYGEFQKIGLDLLNLHPAVRPIR
ncbi:hypothetical protein AB0I34_23015 [Kribbella sp. NPDC050281]|uniref:hypothetical protein n=1 Tax=Kribbella sp. NPDC050281 TaxID=3155515 RepID=UPI003408EFEE